MTVLVLLAPSAAAPALRPIVIGLPGIPPAFLGVRTYVAFHRHLYAKFLGSAATPGVQDFITDADAIQALQSGQIDLAWLSTPVALAAIAKGVPLVGIEGMNSTDWELDSTDPAISSCSALKGRMIGVDNTGGARYDALVVMLSSCNLTINDVKTVDLPGSTGMAALVAGQLTLNVDHLDEARQVQALTGKPLTVVLRLSDVDPYQHFELLVTTEDKLAANRALYVKVLEGDIAAANWLAVPTNLAAGAAIAQITGDSPSVARDALATYVRARSWNAGESGLSVQRITRTIGLGLRLGIIPPAGNSLSWKTVTDTSVWQAASAACCRAP
jgi:ABC-type nitrate/sulfonate/bicarbonate transport system substrate-binding protein